MAELLLRRQYEVQLLQGEVEEGEGTRLLLNLHLSLSQRECQAKEGEGLASF